MKSPVIIYTSVIILSISSAVSSYSHAKVRLYDIIRKTAKKDSGTILFEVRPHKVLFSTTTQPSTKERTTSDEEIPIDKRDSWDSGEERYFKWAALNRRPMESLAGRK